MWYKIVKRKCSYAAKREDNMDEHEENEKKSKKPLEWVVDIFCNLLLATCIIILILRIFVFDIGHVPSGSMEPTLHVGCNLLINKFNPDYTRGDIVVFKSEEFDKILVKRLIGEPGDHVVLNGNTTYINGDPFVEEYVKNPTDGTNVYEFDVPEGCYLFLGDNRISSNDARMWQNSYIKEEALMGEVCLVFDTSSNIQIYIPK